MSLNLSGAASALSSSLGRLAPEAADVSLGPGDRHSFVRHAGTGSHSGGGIVPTWRIGGRVVPRANEVPHRLAGQEKHLDYPGQPHHVVLLPSQPLGRGRVTQRLHGVRAQPPSLFVAQRLALGSLGIRPHLGEVGFGALDALGSADWRFWLSPDVKVEVEPSSSDDDGRLAALQEGSTGRNPLASYFLALGARSQPEGCPS